MEPVSREDSHAAWCLGGRYKGRAGQRQEPGSGLEAGLLSRSGCVCTWPAPSSGSGPALPVATPAVPLPDAQAQAPKT